MKQRLRPDLIPPSPFLQCKPRLTPGSSGVFADPARIYEEFRKAWVPYFCRSGQRDTRLEEFDREIKWVATTFTCGSSAPVDWSDAC